MNKYGPAFIADAEPTNYITFTDPRDGQPITGIVWTMETVAVNRSSARAFTLRGVGHVFTVSANFHINIVG